MAWKMKKFNIGISMLLMAGLGILQACKPDNQPDSRVDTLPYYNEATFTPKWHSPGDQVLDTFHRIPPFTLVNQAGDTINEETFADKIYVVDFFFTTCPGICPKMTANMMALQDEFLSETEVLLLSHSVTPRADSVPILEKYAEDKGISIDTWHLATGDQGDIYRLGRKAYFVEEDLGLEKSEDEFLHTENFVLVDKKRHVRGIYNGLNKTSVRQLIVDIKTLQNES